MTTSPTARPALQMAYYCRTPYMAHAHVIQAENEREARRLFRNWTCESRLPRGTSIVYAEARLSTPADDHDN